MNEVVLMDAARTVPAGVPVPAEMYWAVVDGLVDRLRPRVRGWLFTAVCDVADVMGVSLDDFRPDHGQVEEGDAG